MSDDAVAIDGLTFCHAGAREPALRQVTMSVAPGERCLLVGANGAGKTTLLRVVGGKHMIARDGVTVLGRPAFHDTSLAAEVAFLGGNFPFTVDVRVGDMLRERCHGAVERCERLRGILQVDPDWRMHRISDGQRRRVQLLLGLMHPYRLLLLDEVTTDLDLIGRADLLRFLREECEQRGVATLYATHIFDRLEEWATHLAFLRRGRLVLKRPLGQIDELAGLIDGGTLSPLSHLVERWLRASGSP